MKILNLIISLILISCFFGCNQNKQDQKKPAENKAWLPPKIVEVKNPLIVLIDTCPKSLMITIPVKPGTYIKHTNSGDKAIELFPPVVKTFPDRIAQGKCNFTTYTTDNGLALDAIYCSCIDHFGNLWFGTGGVGVSRYDGKSFTSYTTALGLANNTVMSILEDKKGNLWFGTGGGGVSRYDGKSFTTFTTAQGLANNDVRSILEDKTGNLWFGTEGGGVSRYDGKSFTTFTTAQGLANNDIRGILEDKTGNLWFGTYGNGVSRYDGKSFTNYSMTQGLANNIVLSVLKDKKGNLWFGTRDGGVSRYDGKSFSNYSIVQGLANNTVQRIAEDKKGNLWFGTDGGGVSCYDGKSFISYNMAQGLSNNIVWSITVDKTGNLWFGTFGGGVSRYDGESFTSYTTIQGLSNNIVLSILEDKTGNLWFGTEAGGVSRYDGKSFTSYTTAQGLADNTVCCILEDRSGGIWFGTDGGGVSCYDGKSFTNYTTTQGLANNNVLSIFEDRTGNLWFGTYDGGVSRYDGKSFTNYTTAQGLANNTVLSIMEDKTGNIWFCTYGGGVSRYDGKSFSTYTTAQGLASNNVMSTLEDKTGNLWFGTDGSGISRYDGKSFTSYTTAQGLPDNGIASVLIDKKNNIVVGTNLGVAILKNFIHGTQSKDTESTIPAQNILKNDELKNYHPVFEIYNSKMGFPIKDVNGGSNNGAMLCDSKGIIWAGTGSEKTGLVRFDPIAVNRDPNPPAVILQRIKINEENICWYTVQSSFSVDSILKAQQEIMEYGKVLTEPERDSISRNFASIQFDSISRYYPLPQNLLLPYKFNHVSFDYAAIEPAKPYLVKYQYILEGYDKDWNPITDKTSATFGNISEGTYTFKLKAQGPNGIWSEPITYTFKVLPPLYRAWWAYCIYIISTFLLLMGIYRWRTASLRREKEILEQTVTERTGELVKEKALVEEKNKDITDSINYAKRIQRALLKEEEYVSKHLPEHFILFKPKDIVSGDFYWAVEKQEYFYFAAADCTGHGVPGGFMSMLGLAFLNEITKGAAILTPAEILGELRNKILTEFKQKEGEDQSKDGMDISLMRMNLKTNEIVWSGANNPLYVIGDELEETPADKQPIGYFPLMKPFTDHTVKAGKGSMIYLFSDGYADQFGGPKGKKFKHSRFKEVLLSIHKNKLKEQKNILENTLDGWKGSLDQVDDILVIGIRV